MIQEGLLRDFDHLSIWEVAHRWHDYDPNLTDPVALPLPVQDILRVIATAVVEGKLHFVDRYGAIAFNQNNIPSFKYFIPSQFRDPKGSNFFFDMFTDGEPTINYAELMDENEINKEYDQLVEDYENYHYSFVEPLHDCLENRKFDREVFEEAYVRRDELLHLCLHQGLTPPRFWYTEQYIADVTKIFAKNPTPEPPSRGPHTRRDQDRERCRTIAQTLWTVDPTMPIGQIIQHEAIQRIGNGARYKGRDTIRNWIKDLDPREPDQRIGRPRKKRTDD